MQHVAAFHLGLHCLPKYPFRSFQYTKGLHTIGVVVMLNQCNVMIIIESRPENINNVVVRHDKTQISLGISSVRSGLVIRMKKAYLGPLLPTESTADAQAYLSLHYAHTHLVGFGIAWLILHQFCYLF